VDRLLDTPEGRQNVVTLFTKESGEHVDVSKKPGLNWKDGFATLFRRFTPSHFRSCGNDQSGRDNKASFDAERQMRPNLASLEQILPLREQRRHEMENTLFMCVFPTSFGGKVFFRNKRLSRAVLRGRLFIYRFYIDFRFIDS
jgi:hypothetical protein